MSIKIRRFESSDLEGVVVIEEMYFPTPWPKFFFSQEYLWNPDGFRVAVSGSKVVGYVIWRVEIPMGFGSGQRGKGHLLKLAVDTRYRHQGIGSELLRTCESHMMRRGARYCWLEVRADNSTARDFYLKRSYEDVMTQPSYYLDGSDAIIMRRELNL